MKKKFVVIGDSFAQAHYTHSDIYNEEEHFWIANIKKRLPEFEFLVDGASSRDIQTIIDIWIKLIPHLIEQDYLVIIIPFFNRTRLPLHTIRYRTELDINEIGVDVIDRFVGTTSLELNEPDNTERLNKLEFWGTKHDQDYFEKKLEIQSIINASNASQLNFIEIIEALKKITKAKTHVLSWTIIDKCKTNIIEDKIDILKQIGIWETLHDVWILTNGEFGEHKNLHWSFNMNKKIADFIIKKLNIIKYGK